MVSKILVVEDDKAVREVVAESLFQEGMEAVTAEDGEGALEKLRANGRFDLVLLDLMLPGEADGYSVCREIRAGNAGKENADVPVIVLTARDDETSVVVGLEVGADDYVTKPFGPRELVSRVRAHLRRQRLASTSAHDAKEEEKKLKFPGLTVALFGRRVLVGGEEAELTAKEFDVLALLAASPGRVYGREQIMRHLWEGEFYGEVRSVDVHVQHIRKKIEPDPKNPRYLRTVRGVGYKFADDQF